MAAYTAFLVIAAALHFCALFLVKKWILKEKSPGRKFARCMVAIAPSSAIAISVFAVSVYLAEGHTDPFLLLGLLFGFGQAYVVGVVCASVFLLVLRWKRQESKHE
ncbi:MAG: hypothetical protein M0R80_29330 [Proteobacteria bacterium]|jgi:hypothetical protein|nr:hypothetical protein [Pseudomonadota bacterium]